MSSLVEIKVNYDEGEYVTDVTMFNGITMEWLEAHKAIGVLLHKLVIAEKALNQIYFDTAQSSIEEEALEALKKIRE